MAHLFLALWPDESAARGLDQLARVLAPRLRGKAVVASKIHLTLAFLGDVAAERVELGAFAMASSAFDLTLDCAGSFWGARVAWAGCAAPPPELAHLQSRLADELRGRGYALEERPFAPHLTLVRRIGRPLPREDIAAIGWRVREVTLVRSEAGRYTTVGAWRLAG
jgi:2'-5' RNA ligase